jgi:hypothetical protein
MFMWYHYCRDFVDLFTAIVKVLRMLCERPHVLSRINSIPKMLSTWDGVNRVLQSQLKIEGQYLAQLETKKGSDAGAEQATRRLISRKDQFVVLKTLTNFVRAKSPDAETAATDRSRTAPAALEGEVAPLCAFALHLHRPRHVPTFAMAWQKAHQGVSV